MEGQVGVEDKGMVVGVESAKFQHQAASQITGLRVQVQPQGEVAEAEERYAGGRGHV